MAQGSQADYARHRGVTRAAITKQGKNGLLAFVDGKVDFDASDALLKQNSDPARGGKGGGPNRDTAEAAPSAGQPELPKPTSGSPFAVERAERERVDRQLKQLELDRQLGKVVELDAFVHGMEEAAAACRKEVEGIVQRLPSLVAAESDVRRCRQLIEAEVNRAMETLANSCAALANQQRTSTRG